MVLGPSARMWEDALCASVCQDTRVTPTQAVYRGSVMRTLTVDHSAPVRTTSVWTPAACRVARGLTALCRTTWLSAGVPGEQQEILLGTAGGSLEMRFVLLVGQTLTVRLARMTARSVAANQPTLATPCKGVVMSVTLTETVASHRPVTASNTAVRMLADVEHVERTQTARLSTTVPSAHVLQTSSETPSLAATQNVPGIMTVPLTRPV